MRRAEDMIGRTCTDLGGDYVTCVKYLVLFLE